MKNYGYKYTVHKNKKIIYLSNDGESSLKRTNKHNHKKIVSGYYCTLHDLGNQSGTDITKF